MLSPLGWRLLPNAGGTRRGTSNEFLEHLACRMTIPGFPSIPPEHRQSTSRAHIYRSVLDRNPMSPRARRSKPLSFSAAKGVRTNKLRLNRRRRFQRALISRATLHSAHCEYG